MVQPTATLRPLGWQHSDEAATREELKSTTTNERAVQEANFEAKPTQQVPKKNPYQETEKEIQERKTREERAKQEAQYNNYIVLPPKGQKVPNQAELKAKNIAETQQKTQDLIKQSEQEFAARKAKKAQEEQEKKKQEAAAKKAAAEAAAAQPQPQDMVPNNPTTTTTKTDTGATVTTTTTTTTTTQPVNDATAAAATTSPPAQSSCCVIL